VNGDKKLLSIPVKLVNHFIITKPLSVNAPISDFVCLVDSFRAFLLQT